MQADEYITNPAGRAGEFFAANLAGRSLEVLEAAKGAIRSAIETAEQHGDPFENNPFRRALIARIDESLEARS